MENFIKEGKEALLVDQQTAKDEFGMYRACKNPNLVKTEFGWEIDPIGFRVTMREIY